jgi:hypothetical protein
LLDPLALACPSCCWRTSCATRTAGAAWNDKLLSRPRSSDEYSCWLRRGPRLITPISSPWLTSGTTILTSAARIATSAGDSSRSRSTSTAPGTLRK